ENRRPAHRGAGEEFRHSNRIRPNVQKVIHAHVSALRLRRAAASQGAADPKADWQRGAAQSARGGRLPQRPSSCRWLGRPRRGGKRLSLSDRGMKLPVTLGHENVGEVVATGPDAKGVRIGARMLADPWIGCGSCGPCRRGEENLCRAMKSLGVFSNGGYADYI